MKVAWSVALLASSLSAAAAQLPASQKSRGWDLQRYANCIAQIGGSDLDDETTFTSRRCRSKIQDEKDAANGDFWIDPQARSVVKADSIRVFVDFEISYERSRGSLLGVPLGSGPSGAARFSKVNLLLADKLHTLEATTEIDVKGCSVESASWASSSSCSYREMVSVELGLDQVTVIGELVVKDPGNNRIRGKAFSASGESIAFWIDASEVIAPAMHAGQKYKEQ